MKRLCIAIFFINKMKNDKPPRAEQFLDVLLETFLFFDLAWDILFFFFFFFLPYVYLQMKSLEILNVSLNLKVYNMIVLFTLYFCVNLRIIFIMYISVSTCTV